MSRDAPSFVSGMPQLILRLEAFCLLAGACWAFQFQHASWVLFAVLFFAPDLSMLGYLVNPKIGAAAYNAAHTTGTARWRRMAISRVSQSRLRWGLSDCRMWASTASWLRPEVSTRLWLHTPWPCGESSVVAHSGKHIIDGARHYKPV
jgi:hypothetical protein